VGAARKVIEFLPKVLASPADREGRSALSLAATMAGLAFSNTKTALAHEISYALTLQRGITHGIACSAPLPLVWRLAQGHDAARDAVLAEIFGCPASEGAALLESFLHSVEVVTDLRRYDFSPADIDAILDKAQSGARGRNFIGAQAMRVA
jgi:alcohol dehydrogenase class IV